MVEWSRGFMRIVCAAPESEREDLLDFLEWAKSIAAEFSFYHFTEFYEHFVWRVQRSEKGITLTEYDAVWRVYARTYNVRVSSAGAGQDTAAVVCPEIQVDQLEEEAAVDVGVSVVEPDEGSDRVAESDSGEDPATWCAPGEPGRLQASVRWLALRDGIVRRATLEHMGRHGAEEHERICYEEECERVGCSVPLLTRRAHLVAVAFQDRHDVEFLVRTAACGAGWPSEEMELESPYRVPNYVGPEHMQVMREEIERERAAGRSFLAD
ncbi:hypothetical protein CYMTET_56539 [Cymbomonas tetramitiformis]|uniref:Uncharacterized protein n=1 Tax=Cymbomonas tetramitiformis TaxID=36881 RepID=A0AAE0ELV4_9CHLO|nr:hypothetical protein CYMTET_56539 [Cymbomonas tetramitiformis]